MIDIYQTHLNSRETVPLMMMSVSAPRHGNPAILQQAEFPADPLAQSGCQARGQIYGPHRPGRGEYRDTTYIIVI